MLVTHMDPSGVVSHLNIIIARINEINFACFYIQTIFLCELKYISFSKETQEIIYFLQIFFYLQKEKYPTLGYKFIAKVFTEQVKKLDKSQQKIYASI